MGGVGLMACQGFLVRGAFVCVRVVGLDLFSLECNKASSSVFWGVYELGMALGSPSFNVQCCVPVFLKN